MPVAVITKGTIIGEMSKLVINARWGISGRDKPSAASVPKKVAIRADTVAIKNEFRVARIH